MPLVTLLDVLRRRAEASGQREAYIFLADGEQVGARLTYGQLDRDARALGQRLHRHLDSEPGGERHSRHRVLLVFPPGLDFIRAYLACFYAGAIAVPAYPPRFHRPQPRLRSILRDARPALALTVESIARRVDVLARYVPEAAQVPWWPIDDGWMGSRDADVDADQWAEPELSADDLAFLQYTSGSTSEPKGVMVSHGNLVHNETLIQTAFDNDESTRVVSWLPLYHDMGLIGGVLQPLFLGSTCVLMSPMSFLQKPLRWLQAISDQGRQGLDVTSGGPNFAYELTASRATAEDLEQLDLSRWRVAFNGSEPIRASTLQRFAEVFEPCGFDPRAFFPCYGLAEATLFVTGGVVQQGAGDRGADVGAEWGVDWGADRGAVTLQVDEVALGHDRVEPAESLEGSEGATTLVASGGIWHGEIGVDVAIVDPETHHRVEQDRVGEIWLRGDSVAQGYWANPQRTQADFHATIAGEAPERSYLRTGDLGFLHRGQLFVTGRLKDLIILRGRNYYPQDIEATLDQAHPAVRPGNGAAFSVDVAERSMAELLVIVQEIERRREDEAAGALEALRQAVSDEHALAVHEVVLLRAGTLPKTTSGKIQRHAARQAYLDDELTVVARSGMREGASDVAPAERSTGSSAQDRETLPIELLSSEALEGLPFEQRRAWIETYLRQAAARACARRFEEIDVTLGLPSLGLDSLAAVELQHRVEADVGIRLDLAPLLEGVTLRQLADDLARRASEQAARDVKASPAATRVAEQPLLSHGQRALWFLHRVSPESGAYNIAVAARLSRVDSTGEASFSETAPPAASIHRALLRLIDRHPALRSRFEEVEGEPLLRSVERRASDGDEVLDWRTVNVSSSSPPDADLQHHLEAHAWAPFSLTTGPLVRARWFEIEGADPVLLLVIHHIVADFWSLGLLVRELGRRLSEEQVERPLQERAPILDASPSDFSRLVAQRRQRLEQDGERLFDYWRQALDGAPFVLELPTDHPRPPRQDFHGAAVNTLVDPEVLEALDASLAGTGATRFQALLALFQLWLARLSGQRDVVVGTPWAGRESVDAAAVVGYLVEPLALRGVIPAGATYLDLLAATRRRVLDAFAHSGLPFALLAERLQPSRDASRSPIFQAMLVLQRAARVEEASLGAFALGWPGARLRVGDIELESVEVAERWSQFDLTLRAAELVQDGERGSLLLSLQYATALFDATTAQRWSKSLVRLLRAALDVPGRPVDTLPWLSRAEYHQLWVEYPSAPRPRSSGDNARSDDLASRFFAAAARTPRKQALLSIDADGHIERWTYQQLATQVRRRSTYLRTLGIGPEQPVGVLCPRGPAMLVSLLAVLDAGAAYLPLDPNYPSERLEFTLRDAGARWLLTTAELAERTALDDDVRWLDVEAWGVAGDEDADADVDQSSSGDPAAFTRDASQEGGHDPDQVSHLAYLIYTSGSTGRPKGVAIEHRAALNLLDWARDVFPAPVLEGVAAVTSICFDLSVFELFLPLTTGGRVVLLPDALALATLPREHDGQQISDELTLINTVPSAMTELLRLDALPVRSSGMSSDMSDGMSDDGALVVNLAGEPLTASLAEQLYARPQVEAVFNLYGPSEDTTYSTWSRVPRPVPGSSKEPTIGRPIASTRAYVVALQGSRQHDPQPLGIAGELVLAGGGLARGYHARPALTAERFRPEGGREAGARAYRTGDLARWRRDGELEFLGRLDHQVKLRGFRIELGEIESRMTSHPAVHEAAVLTRDVAGETQLVAVAAAGDAAGEEAEGTPQPTQQNLVDALREHLGSQLPAFMVPSFVQVRPELPHTPNGKIDRRALAAEVDAWLTSAARTAQAAGTTSHTEPQTETEQHLASLWAQVLGLPADNVRREDNFFAQGGHSLAVARLVAQIREQLQVDIPLTLPFEAQTLAQLASAVDAISAASSDRGADESRSLPSIEPASRDQPLHLTSQQHRLWLFDRLHPASPAYNVPGRLRIEGPLDVQQLDRALQAVVERHEPLRTSYAEGASNQLGAADTSVSRDQPHLHIHSRVRIDLPLVDLTALTPEDRRAAVSFLSRREALRGFDLRVAPMVRAVLLRGAPQLWELLLSMHHIAGDGWSLGVLARDLGALYRGETLPPLPLQYADFALWRREYAQWEDTRSAEEDVEWWRARLTAGPNGFEALSLPTDHSRPASPSYRGGAVELHLDAALVEAATAFATSRGATPFMLLVAVFQLLLARLANQVTIVLGTPVAGREDPRTRDLIGFFADTLLLRADVQRASSFEEFLDQVREFSVGAFGRQGEALERATASLASSIDRPSGQTSLFRAMLAFNNAPFRAPELPGLEVDASAVETVTQKFDLTLSFWQPEQSLGEHSSSAAVLDGALGYASDLFERSTAERWVRYFEALLSTAITDSTVPLASLSMLSAAERAEISVWGRPKIELGGELAAGSLVPEKIDAQLRSQPRAIAVRLHGAEASESTLEWETLRETSRGDLDAMASDLAWRLRRLGAGHESVVALLAQRVPETLAAIQGIWRAGSAFVILEPTDPPERLEHLLRDSSPVALVTAGDVQMALESLDVELPVLAVESRHQVEDTPVFPAVATSREQLAYVLYTSGSTGLPKGVAVSHGALADYVQWAGDVLLHGIDTLPATTRFSFDAAWKQIFVPLSQGKVVDLWPSDWLREPDRLVRALSSVPFSRVPKSSVPGRVAFNCVPSLWQAILTSAEDDAPIPRVDRLLVGGEALTVDLVDRTRALLPEVEIVNLYGPTEATANASAAWLQPGDAITLGHAVPGLELRVLRLAGTAVPMVEPMPQGIPGELCLAGTALARGYLGRPALTAERFVPEPFASRSSFSQGGERLYRTGDLVRWRRVDSDVPGEGRVEPEFLGRLDHQIKLRGVRVELAEIEARLRHDTSVDEAVALVVQPRGRSDITAQRLVAFVTPVDTSGVESRAQEDPTLRDHLRRHLPAAVVPSVVWRVDALPRLAAGKVDRRALMDAAVQRLDQIQTPSEARWTPHEQIVADIFADVLAIDPETLRPEDDFFALGGHSLLATQVTSRIRRAFDVDLPLRDLFETPSLRALAHLVETRQGGSIELPPLQPLVRTDASRDMSPDRPPYRPPLSFAQQRLWLLDRLDPGSPAYNIPIAVEVHGDIDIDALGAALARIVERHAILRTRLPLEIDADGVERPYQEVLDPEFQLPRIDASRVAPLDLAPLELVRQAVRRPFVLARGPLMRALWVRAAEPRPGILLLVFHHTVADGWSVGILLRELQTFYADLEATVPALPIQYADYAAWQRDWLADSETLDAQLDYWRHQLDPDALLELPTDHPRPAARRLTGATLPVALSAQLVESVSSLGRRSGATLFMVVLAAWQILLARHAGQTQVQIGTPIAGRRWAETEGLIGLFVNTLVLRGDVDGRPSFLQFLDQIRSTTLDAHAHQDVPFEKLVEALVPHRDTARTPLFQALLALQNTPMPALHLERSGQLAEQVAELQPLDLTTQTSKFDLSLLLRPSSRDRTGLEGGIEFDSALFDRTTIERLWRSFTQLLRSIVATPEAAVHRLQLLDAAERHQLLREWNPVTSCPTARPDENDSLPARVRAQDPERITVVHGREHLSYGELIRRAEALAVELRAHGAGPEQVVGLCLPRSVELVVAILGTLVAGAAYLPLDPAYPEERRQFSLEDGGAVVVVEAGGEPLTPSFPLSRSGERGMQIRRVGGGAPLPSAGEGCGAPGTGVRGSGVRGSVVRGSNLAYLLYTSGSTGKPKGVLIPQANVLRLLDATDPWFRFGPDDTWTLFHSYAFDFSVWELWGALAYGGRLVVVPYLVSREPARFRQLLAEQRVTVLNQTPSAFRPLIEADLSSSTHLPLRRVIFGGEALEPAALRPWVERYGDEQPRLINMYGITETTVHVTHRRLRRADVMGEAPASLIGEAIPDLRLYVLDRYAGLVPIGVVGELYVGSAPGVRDAGLARGYHGRPALTAERFVPDPFVDGATRYLLSGWAGGGAPLPRAGEDCGVPGTGVRGSSRTPTQEGDHMGSPLHGSEGTGVRGQRLYRSGDLVRFRADGELEYLGRADHQVKVRGFRIELGEIETVLGSLDGVREAAVLVDGVGEAQRLVAFVVGEIPDSLALRRELLEHLPDHMVPAAFVPLEQLPLTVNGKLDRRALLALDIGVTSADLAVAPRDELEARIDKIWREVLDLEVLGVHDDFFALGGHSLLAVQVLGRLRKELGVDLALARLFENPTVAALATHVRPKLASSLLQDASSPIPSVPTRDGLAPLSSAQRRLWLLHQLDPTSSAYHVPLLLELRGSLDVQALKHALDALVERHAVLRTRFRTAADPNSARGQRRDEPVQRIDPPRPRALPVVETHEDTEALVHAFLTRPFDLEHEWPMRVCLLRFEDHPGRHLLLLVLHHIAADGWSLGVLLRELGALTRGEALPPLALQYADFARWQVSSGAQRQDELDYWRARLQGLPPLLELPTDSPRPPVRRDAGARIPIDWSASSTAALEQLARARGTTLFVVLLAGFMTWLGRLSGARDLAVGTPVAGREPVEVETLIGFFVNTLVLRGDLTDNPTFSELLEHLHRTTLRDFEHRELPFEQLVEVMRPERATAHTPLFQVMLALQNAPLAAPQLPGVEVTVRDVDPGSSKFDLTLGLLQQDTPEGAVLRGALEYATDLFDRTTAQRWVGQLHRLLWAASQDPATRLSALPLLSAAEQQAVRHEWATAPAVGVARGEDGAAFPRRIAARAQEQPDAIVLVAGDQHVSYRALWRRVSRLAETLRCRGVGPEVPVAVCLRRTPRLLVALLAVMEAGGFYVPLDPAYPGHRLQMTLEDSGARLLVSERVVLEDDKLHAVLDSSTLESVEIDALDLNASIAGAEVEDIGSRCPAMSDNLAYLIYTSGSTGRPKGVAIRHRSTAALLGWASRTYRRDDFAGVLASTSINFDISVFELFVTASLGGCVVLADDALHLPTLPAASRVSLIDTVPSAMQELLHAGAHLPAATRTVNLAGEALPRELLRRLESLEAPPRVINLYGPSEDTTFSTWATVSDPSRGLSSLSDAPSNGASVSLGRLVDGGKGWVLDRQGQPVPIGVAGELLLGGLGISRGYLGQPGLTADRYRPDPFGGDGERLYRSGDLVRWSVDGRLSFLGRLDHQVKVRGFRIELGEVEAALRQNPALAAVAAGVRRWDGQDQLVAYLVPAADAPTSSIPESSISELSISRLRRDLVQILPAHLVPTRWRWLDALPMTPNGKVDRRALATLPWPDATSEDGGEEVQQAPIGPVEEALAALWRDTLGVPSSTPLHRASNFFDLGGHSLLATRLLNRLREDLAVEVPLAEIFAAPTLAELADRIEVLRGAVRSKDVSSANLSSIDVSRIEIPSIVPAVGPTAEAQETTAPLSFAQERLWFLEQLQPGNIAYNVPLALRLRPSDSHAPTGAATVAPLAVALGRVRQRHDVLRTTFAEVDGQARQLIAPRESVRQRLELPCVDLRRLALRHQATVERRLITQEARRPFELSTGPLLRAVLLLSREGSDDQSARATVSTLLLTLHHIVADAWSFDVLMSEIAFALRHQAPPPLPIQYADFARWQRRDEVAALLYEPQLAYWRKRLAGSPEALDLPFDHPRPAVQTWQGDSVAWALPAELGHRLDAFGRQHGYTPFMLLCAAFQAVLGRYANSRDVSTGMPIAGRSRRETEELIGFFTNTLVLRVQLEASQRSDELLQQVRTATLEAYDHQDTPFERLVDELRPARALSHQPLFQVIFSLQASSTGGEALEVSLPGYDVELLEVDRGSAKFDLGLFLRQQTTPQGLTVAGGFEYNTALFEASTIERLRRHTQTMLDQLLRHPDLPVDALSILAGSERQQLLHAWQGDPPLLGTGFEQPALEPVQRRVLRCADTTPDATALLFYAGFAGAPYPGALSYGELARYVRRLAVWLQQPHSGSQADSQPGSHTGVGLGHVVAVVCGRCPELFIALLATLEAGAAFLPVDPTYPQARRDFMLEDSGATVVLTQRDIQAALVSTRPQAESMVEQARRRERETHSEPDIHAQRDVQHPLGVDTPAYVIYTSGSTGRPKGTIVGHRTLGNLLRWQHQRTRDVHPEHYDRPLRTLQFSSPSFDVAQQEIFATWQAGGTLVLLGHGERRDPTQVLRRLAEAGVERLFLPFVALQQLAELVHAGVHRHELPTQLREVITAGEQLRVTPQLRGLFRRLPGCRLWNHYGPSETHVVTAELLPPDPFVWDDLPAIGLPVDACRVYLLPPNAPWAREPVPLGVAGEMCLAGEAPGFGYLRRPAATARVFQPDPFSPVAGGRMYRSGDLARRRKDGRLDFLGRADHQVKVRGYRVELGEIESVLGKLPQLRDAVVVAREDVPGDKRLVAYLLAAPEVDLTASTTLAEIKTQLGVELPEHMMPSVLVPLDVLPLLPSGKVDRKALPAPTLVTTGAAYVAPENEVEALIAGAWREVLHLEQVGVEDNFFEIGGSSLLIVQLRSRLQAVLGRQIPLVDLFQAPTVRAMAERFGRAEAELEEKPAALEAVQERGKARKKSLARLKKKRRRR